MSLPYAHLNLRRNPFGELSREERARLAVVDLDGIHEHLLQPGAVVQIEGEKGFGKTTHLLSLAARFPDAAYVYLPEGQHCEIPSTGEPLLIDEAQRLTPWQRWRTFRSGRRLVLGTHADYSRQLRRAGRPVLATTADRFTDAERIGRILNTRIESFRRGAGGIPRVTQATAARLHRDFGADIRAMEDCLYHVFQQLRSIQDV